MHDKRCENMDLVSKFLFSLGEQLAASKRDWLLRERDCLLPKRFAALNTPRSREAISFFCLPSFVSTVLFDNGSP